MNRALSKGCNVQYFLLAITKKLKLPTNKEAYFDALLTNLSKIWIPVS